MSKRVAQKRAERILRAQRERARRRRIWIYVVAVAVLVMAGTGGYLIFRSQQPDDAYARPASLSSDGTGLVVGTGPVTVELFSDFLCPACRAFDADARDDIDRLLTERRITLVYRPVAILDRMSSNEYSTRSAAGAGCAADAGKLIEYSKALFDRQPAEGGAGHSNEELIRLGTDAGITDPGFGQCIRDGRYLTWVGQVTGSMAPRGVNGTPTVFVAAKQLSRPTGDKLVSAVDAATTK